MKQEPESVISDESSPSEDSYESVAIPLSETKTKPTANPTNLLKNPLNLREMS